VGRGVRLAGSGTEGGAADGVQRCQRAVVGATRVAGDVLPAERAIARLECDGHEFREVQRGGRRLPRRIPCRVRHPLAALTSNRTEGRSRRTWRFSACAPLALHRSVRGQWTLEQQRCLEARTASPCTTATRSSTTSSKKGTPRRGSRREERMGNGL
jgi:hypothetical protein